MKLVPIIAFTMFLLTTADRAAGETICGTLSGSIADLEDLKASIASGEFGIFLEYVEDQAAPDTPDVGNYEQILREAYPDGFDDCLTILSERSSDRLVTEIVVFKKQGANDLYVTWIAYEYNQEWIIPRYLISNNFGEILEVWR